MNWEKFIRFVKSILYKENIYIDSEVKEQILVDAISDAHLLCMEKGLRFENDAAEKSWICRTAAYKFMHHFKFYEKVELTTQLSLEENYSDSFFIIGNEISENSFKEILIEYCNEFEIQLLLKHYYYGFTIKEIAEEFNMNYETVYKKHQRLLVRLKKDLPP